MKGDFFLHFIKNIYNSFFRGDIIALQLIRINVDFERTLPSLLLVWRIHHKKSILRTSRIAHANKFKSSILYRSICRNVDKAFSLMHNFLVFT